MGGCIGSLGTTIPIIATLCTPNRYIATSVSLGSSMRGLGGSIGIVIFSSIFTNKLEAKLPAYAAKAVVLAGLPQTSIEAFLKAYLSGSASAIETVPGVTPAVVGAVTVATGDAYADSWRYIWYATLPFMIVSLVVTCFVKSPKQQMTLEVASAVEARHDNRPHATEAKVAHEEHGHDQTELAKA